MAKTRFVHFEQKSFVPTENLVGFVPTEILVPCSYVHAGIHRASSPKVRQSYWRALRGTDQQKSESPSKWPK